MLQGFNWCSEINFALEELFARYFIQFIGWITVCWHIGTARVVKALDHWMVVIIEALYVLDHFVVAIRLIVF